MPQRARADHEAIVRVYKETGSGAETGRRLGLHRNTVYQVLALYHGKCRVCRQLVRPGHSYCEKCLEHLREKEREDRKQRRRLGRCAECDDPVDPPSRTLCAKHRLLHIEANERYDEKNRLVQGGLPSEEERRRRLRQMYGEAGWRVWNRLGGRCVICGIGHEDRAVHVHHVDGNPKNGAEENLTLLCQPCHRLVHLVIKHPDIGRALTWIRATYPNVAEGPLTA